VRAKKGNDNIERAVIVKSEQCLEQAQLSRRLQTVTRLGFDRGRAISEHAQ
jgi:hypothetical protein